MKRIMHKFRMNEISAVDRPAQAHAKSVIMKRADDADDADDIRKDMYGVARFADMLCSIGGMVSSAKHERDYEGDNSPVPEKLRDWLANGATIFHAMATEELDELLACAVKKQHTQLSDDDAAFITIGKRKFDAAARRKDAKSGAAMPDGSFPILDAEDLSNAEKLAGHAKNPSAARAHIRTRAKALGLEHKLSGGYRKSIVQQFEEQLGGKSPDEMDAALKAASGDAQTQKGATMTDEEKKAQAELQKKLDASTAELAASNAQLAKFKELEKAKMSAKHGAYYSSLKDQEKEDFLAMSEGERDKKIAANPDKQEDTPPKLKKALEDNEAMAKRLQVLEDEREDAAFAKRAEDLGLHKDHGAIMRKAYAGDKDAIGKLEQLLKSLAAQVETGKLFSEIGTNRGGDATSAEAMLKVKADEYAAGQTKIGKRCSPQQAWTAVYTDTANVDLKKRYDSEEIAKRGRAA